VAAAAVGLLCLNKEDGGPANLEALRVVAPPPVTAPAHAAAPPLAPAAALPPIPCCPVVYRYV